MTRSRATLVLFLAAAIIPSVVHAQPPAYLTQWGSPGSGNGQFNDPYLVAIDASGNVYVAEALNHRIQKFDNSGAYVTQWGTLGSGTSQFNSPHGVAVDGSGNVYVCDSGNHRIQKFDSNGTYLSQWGTFGSGNGQLYYPVGIAIDAANNVYIGDYSNSRIQKFTSTGTYITQWGSAGGANGQFFNLIGVAIDPAGYVYVGDSGNNRIEKFSSTGTYLAQWGTQGNGNGQLNSPHGVAIDGAGNVIVCDSGNDRMEKFTSTGSYLAKWGSSGTGNGQFSFPVGVAADPYGNVFVADRGNNRIQEFGGPLVQAHHGIWIGLGPPSARTEHAAIYDPVRRRMIMIGGNDGDNPNRNDVWALPVDGPPAWKELLPEGPLPPARYQHTAVYDPVRDRIIVFGGYLNGTIYLGDVWSLSLKTLTWSQLNPTGPGPSPRRKAAAIYDPVRDRMLIFGGQTSTFGYENDVWALSLSGSPTWSHLAPTGTLPSARHGHTAVYDPVRDQLLVFGGKDGSGLLNDVWSLTLAGTAAWSVITPSGTLPVPRDQHAAIYDPVRDRMLVFGGEDAGIEGGTPDNNELWELSLSGSPTWTLIPAAIRPDLRYGHTMIYDPVGDQLVTFGGVNVNTFYHDTWSFSLSGSHTWGQLAAPPTGPPPARQGHTTIYDPVRDRMVVFGGAGGSSGFDVWTLSLSGSQMWTQITPAGTPPTARRLHSAIYDPIRDQMVVFGGAAGAARVNEVWTLSLSGGMAWNQVFPTGTPPSPRYGHCAIYDGALDRMVVFGGNDGTTRNDTWTLSLSGTPSWSLLTPTGTSPEPRQYFAGIYDPLRGRLLIFGGYVPGYYNDVWALSLTGSPAWSQLLPNTSNGPPSERYGHTGIYDPVRDRMVVFGGYPELDDVWALPLSGAPVWTKLIPLNSPPRVRMHHTAIYDPVRDRMIMHGGGFMLGSIGILDDTWSLVWGAPASVESHGSPTSGVRFAGPWPNPSRGATSLQFEIGEPGHVVLDVLDVEGRRVARLADGEFTAGLHTVEWRGNDETGRMARSGVYFVRLQAAGRQASHRIVWLR